MQARSLAQYRFAVLVCLAVIGCSERDAVELTEEQNYFVLAADALNSGDDAKAMEMLAKSIETKPSRYAHYERAKLYEKQGDDEQALADCVAALQLQPGDKDVLWLQGEIKKPKDKRFKGRFANPPSAAK